MGSSLAVATALAAVLLTAYLNVSFGLAVDGLWPGSHTLTRRPSGSYARVVDLPLTSTFCVGWPRPGSNVVVVVLPARSLSACCVTALPEAGVNAVLVVRCRASVVEVARPYWSYAVVAIVAYVGLGPGVASFWIAVGLAPPATGAAPQACPSYEVRTSDTTWCGSDGSAAPHDVAVVSTSLG